MIIRLLKVHISGKEIQLVMIFHVTVLKPTSNCNYIIICVTV